MQVGRTCAIAGKPAPTVGMHFTVGAGLPVMALEGATLYRAWMMLSRSPTTISVIQSTRIEV